MVSARAGSFVALVLLIGSLSKAPAFCTSFQALTADDAYALATQAYLYAYPLVLMEATRDAVPNRPMNRFQHAPAFPTPNSRTVVRPNVDTLYSSAWLDLTREPVVMTVPDTGSRYYLIQMMDAWTETFAVPGTRTTGNKAGTFVIVGPDFKGSTPSGMTVINSPTNMVWVLGRIQTNGSDDIPNVRALQRGFQLAPLSGAPQPAPAPASLPAALRLTPPQQVAELDAGGFFGAFMRVLNQNRPHEADAGFVSRLKPLGIVPGHAFDPSSLPAEYRSAIDRAARDAHGQLARAREISSGDGSGNANGWRQGKIIGRYGTAYRERALVARTGLGALPVEDAMYPSTAVDARGRALSGDAAYVLHFTKAEVPPVNAFWSMTMYDADGYFVPNSIDRYAIGDRDRLTFNEDGSLDIYIQAARPSEGRVTNWLPAPAGPFNLSLRLYWPKPEALSGAWHPPLVRRVP